MSAAISNLSAWDQYCLKIGSQNLVTLLDKAEEQPDRTKYLAEVSGLPESEIPGELVMK
jgi:hypothetical protein